MNREPIVSHHGERRLWRSSLPSAGVQTFQVLRRDARNVVSSVSAAHQSPTAQDASNSRNHSNTQIYFFFLRILRHSVSILILRLVIASGSELATDSAKMEMWRGHAGRQVSTPCHRPLSLGGGGSEVPWRSIDCVSSTQSGIPVS